MPPRSRKRERANGGGQQAGDLKCVRKMTAKGSTAAATTAATTAGTSTGTTAGGTNDGASPPDYSLRSVWDKRYQDGVFVEWYCGFDHVRPLFERFVPKDSRVLDVGCGDKPLAWDLRDAGYTGKITSFDFSPTVIEKLLAENRSCERKRLDEGVDFRVLDARDLPFETGSFDLVVDKGTVDAMLCDKAGKGNARAICREAARVVAAGGWFVIVSHIHPSTIEGMELLSETLVPALQESSAVSARRNAEEEEEEEEEGVFFWSVDVHCGDDGDGGREESEGESDDGGGGGGGGGGGRAGGGEGRGVEAGEGERDHDGDGDGASGQIGPSAYMARKVARRHTRASATRGQSRQQRAIPIRIHEY